MLLTFSFAVFNLPVLSPSQVTKNRFDGVLGRVPLEFVRDSLCMSGFGKSRGSQPTAVPSFQKRDIPKHNVTRIVADDVNLKHSARPYGRAAVMKYSVENNEGSRGILSSGAFSKYKPDTRVKEVNTDLSSHGDERSASDSRAGTLVSVVPKGGNLHEAKGSSVGNGKGQSTDATAFHKASAVRTAVNKMLKGTQLYTKAINKTKQQAAVAVSKTQEARK